MGASDALLQEIIRDSAFLLRGEAGLRASVLLELDLLRERIESLLMSNDPVSAKALAKLVKRVNDAIDESMATIHGGVEAVLSDLASMHLQLAVKNIDASIGVNLARGVSKAMVKSIMSRQMIEGAPNAEWWQRQGEALKNRFLDEMRQGILQNETLGDLVRRVRGRREFGFKDGIMQTTTARAEAIVRTSVMAVANDSRLEVWQQNDDLIKELQWVSVLDNRTSAICRALDGKRWSLPDYRPVGHTKEWPGPSAHWNCRSTQVPVLKSWSELTGRKLKEAVPSSTRASMNGQVPADMTYNDWLKEQPEALQQEVLGKAKWRLWKQGKLTLEQMTDQRNNPLTLAQLKKRLGVEA